MNTKYYILLLFVAMMFVTGCQKLTEDPKGTLSPGTYFKTQSDLDASVASIYERYAHDYNYGFTTRMTSCFGSDDLTTDPALNKGDMREFDELNGSSTTGSYGQQWTGMWSGIYQANNVIANYQKVNSTDDLKNAAAAQAYFIRAWSYYMLVRTFGPVPLIIVPTDVNARPARDEVSTVYASIVSDLQTAISLFPSSFQITAGRANQWSSKALLADVYLTMAGWPLNDASKYALAAAAANDVIQSGQYSLVPDFAKVFSTNNSTESVFSFQFNVAGGTAQRGFGLSSVPLEEVAIDAAFGGNGNSGWDDYYPEINFFKNAPKCTRTDATFYTTIKLRNDDKKTFTLVPWNSNLTHAQHPYYKKFRSGLNGDGVTETDNTIITMNASTNKALDVIRYPMVLLDYAEASAMASNSPTGTGYAAINVVRERAGLPALTVGLSATAFRDSVVNERAYEFAGENGVRWFDVVRLQLLPKIISQRAGTENPIPGAIVADPSTRYLAPIPQNEMYRNPTWTQNTGY
jgi:hypothetical protein